MVDFRGTFRNVSDFLTDQDTGGIAPNPPLTQTATSHAITIRTDRGLKIGRIQNWSPSISRTVDTVFEVNANNTGEPIERVPQIQANNRITVERYELYTFHIGEAFGVPVVNGEVDLVNLTRQAKPFSVREVWRDPFGDIRAYLYTGIWFADWGITISSSDDRIIKSRATLEFTRRIRLN